MRSLREEEFLLLQALLQQVPHDTRLSLDQKPLVEDMNDGGMGSIRFVEQDAVDRKMGSELIAARYIDSDQVPVLISINLDQKGRLFEIDFWKVDFSKLNRYPTPDDLQFAPQAG